MKAALRTVAGIAVGLLLAFLLVVAVEMFSAVVHPLPKDFDGSTEQMCEHVARYPQWVLAVVVPMWAATAFAGVWTAGRLGNRLSAAVVGLLLIAAVALNVSMLPYSLWFKIATLLAIPVVVVVGVWTTGTLRAPASPDTSIAV